MGLVERTGLKSVSLVRDPLLKMEGEGWRLCPGDCRAEGSDLRPASALHCNHHLPPLLRVRNIISGRAPGGAGEGQVPSHVRKEVQRILGHIQAPPRPFLLR